ncbi:YqzL family protein [Acetanaerobacterium elongatum]|uniref:YqzL family protein n=1 Tax=Acetanaerobacterium elongatum TaxID=258515 RepID=UPI001FA80052|nr:YqzL family protein [Acetanaerobacterium elongatum]
MDREALWRIFEDTGSVEAYLLYKDNQFLQGLAESEEPQDADMYRGSGAKG